MSIRRLLAAACAALLGCSTPYAPPEVVKGAPKFPGLADMLKPGEELDVVLVHGMCTHDSIWANEAMDALLQAMDSNISRQPAGDIKSLAPAAPAIELVDREVLISGGKLKLTALVWSSLTAPLKQQLEYDDTGKPTDCANDAFCKPQRAKYNGMLKDQLLNDCLSDALIYQGASRGYVRDAMVAALDKVLSERSPQARLALVSDSLGSKIVFDALSEMLDRRNPTATAAMSQLGQLFMQANQLPILGLADQDLAEKARMPISSVDMARDGTSGAPPGDDSLQRFLAKLPTSRHKDRAEMHSLMVVALTDPNDLLSYRLMPSRYASKDVGFADVLVSNSDTILGLLERPDTAHMGYMTNKAVAGIIACGVPRSMRCQ